MSFPLRRLVRLCAAAVVVLFAALYFAQHRDAFLHAATALSPPALAAALAFGALYWLALAAAWWQVQSALGGTLEFWPAVRIWTLSTVARYVPGNLWHIAGRAALAKEAGESAMVTVTASAYEQMLTLGGAFLAAGLLLPLAGGSPLYLAGALAAPLGAAALHPAAQRAVVHRAARLLGQPPPPALPVRRLVRLLALYMLPNIPAGLALAALGWPGGPNPIGAIGAFGFAWAVGFLSFFTPSGLGIREVTLVGLIAAGLSAGDPAVLAVGHRLVLTAAEFALAAGAGLSERLTARVV
ncbi:MAG: hypothetical protein RMM58_09625 [Chloroflexota bacterium]|nr:hypothetical protein [Dehalococcoidia bacterium]MDW8254127.1 hypothetical protein [Chloroflexota bacterium]